jgi:hypothetical protein
MFRIAFGERPRMNLIDSRDRPKDASVICRPCVALSAAVETIRCGWPA